MTTATKSSLPPVNTLRWFYHDGEEERGPVDFRELRYQALKGKIAADTKIWKHDDAQPRVAHQIDGLLPQNSTVDDLPPEGSHPTPAPAKARTIMDGPPGGLYLPYLKSASFTAILALLGAFGAFLYFSLVAKDETLRVPLLCFTILAGLGFLGLALLYLKRAWEMLRAIGSQRSGNQAITMMAIPLYSAVACFPIIFGWSSLWNRQIRTHPGFSTSRGVFRPVYFLFCLGFFASQSLLLYHFVNKSWPQSIETLLDQVSFGIWGTTLLLGLMAWAGFCRTINFLAKKKS